MKLHRLRTGDEGSIAVMAAVIVPVVLLVIALALASLVWATSETETQRAADEGALQAAASALLVDFPYSTVSTLSTAYPTLRQKVPAGTLPELTPCESLSDPVEAVEGLTTSTTTTVLGVTTTLTSPLNPLLGATADELAVLNGLPGDCTGLSPIAPIPNLPTTSRREACESAAKSMLEASYALRFYADDPDDATDSPQPTCANRRIRAAFATQSPLIGFGTTTVGAGGELSLSAPPELSTVHDVLEPLGVRLDTTLPNAVCPQVNVEVDQPVREPVFDRASTPNGRATARRVVKNAVVVPVFNGLALTSAHEAVAAADDLLATVTGKDTLDEVRLPAQNLNTTLLAEQKRLLALLDQVDVAINARLAAANAAVAELNGVTDPVLADASETLGVPVPPVTANLGSLNLLKCLRDTVSQVFDPPSGDAPTVEEVLASAAATGEPVQLIQVGAMSCTGAVSAVEALRCVQAATGTVAGSVTGLYDIPFLDVTPALVKDVGDGQYQAVPVHASQASGAFRASLVRAAGDSRYAPRLVSP